MSPPPPAVPDPGRPRLVRARGRSGESIRGRRRSSNGSQSSRGAAGRLPPTALAVGGVAVVALVALGLRLMPDAGRVAVAPASSTAADTATAPSAPSPSPAASPSGVRAPGGALARPARVPTAEQLATGVRADGSVAEVPATGSGEFRHAHERRATTATRGRLIRFDVSVEHGVAVDPDQAALLIARVLDDDRSWRGLGLGRFTLVPAGEPADVHAYLATPGTTDRLCAPLLTRGRVSCQNGSRVVLNAERWVDGAKAYGDDTTGYRRYLVNHEFGHALGRGHVGCPGRGRPAPVMMQQTKGLQGCRASSWPTRTRG